MDKDTILREFMLLCQIPHPSGHEEAIAAHLQRRLRELGYESVVDNYKNVIGEIPATVGCEEAPTVLLQAHSDMVCVAAETEGDYDPLTDPIKTVVSEGKMRALGTSLGADDGIGVAIILGLLQADFPHGPLRVLFTADEEAGMSGAANLAPAHCAGRYLINLDWEEAGSICIGCAGTVNALFRRGLSWQPLESGTAYEVEIAGLKGGHSGVEIHEGRANANKELGVFGDFLLKNGIAYRLASLQGGTALNVIANQAQAVIALAEADRDAFIDLFEDYRLALAARYDGIEEEMRCQCREVPLPKQAVTAADSRDIVHFLAAYPQGVETMSSTVPDLVETSANLGTVTMAAEIVIGTMARSSNRNRHATLFDSQRSLAEQYGFTGEETARTPSWPPVDDSELVRLAREIWRGQHGREPRVLSFHAGVECGFLLEKNPQLDAISLGPTMRDVHSVEETLYTSSIMPTAQLVMGLLTAIGRGGSLAGSPV